MDIHSMLNNTNKKQIVVGLLFIFTEHLKLNQMKTRKVKRSKMIVGDEYYDTKHGGGKMVYLGIFADERGDQCIYFYPIDETCYDVDADGTIPFMLDGLSFYEQKY